MRHFVTAVLLSVAWTATASAAGIVNVRSIPVSEVYLDDQAMGATPLAISGISRGDHVLKLVEPVSGNAKRLYFRIPNRVNIQKDINVEFYPDDEANTVLRADGSDAAHVAPKALPNKRDSKQVKRDSKQTKHKDKDNSKVRIRNTALGVGAVGLLTGSTPLKAIGLGGALVNELVNE